MSDNLHRKEKPTGRSNLVQDSGLDLVDCSLKGDRLIASKTCANDSTQTLPAVLIEGYVAEIANEADVLFRRGAEVPARTLKSVVEDLRTMLADAGHQWVNTSTAARLLDKSEETVRRWCRKGDAPFSYTQTEGGQYMIWLPDLNGGMGNAA